jgi:uncharacterized membrane protein
MTKIASILAAAIVLASASIASAATVKAAKQHHVHRGAVMLLEDNGARAAGSGTSTAERFQSNWNIGY